MFILFVVAGTALMALAHVAPFPFLLEALARGQSHWEMPAGAPVTNSCPLWVLP